MPDGGISQGELRNAISSLRSELRSEFDAGLRGLRAEVRNEIKQLRAELQNEIRRLEEEMRQIGEMIVNAIEGQTIAMTAGMAATTAMVESTRRQIEDDFTKTRESTLQIEVGKKVAEARSVRDKMNAFVGDIKSRFDRALITSAQNRELYNVAFRNLTDEYGAKIRSIGAHIFQIRMDDIAPAMKAAAVPLEEAHGLPIEMDLERLKRRSDQLDAVLALLKDSRLDDVVSSLDTLESQLDASALHALTSVGADDYCVEALATRSDMATQVFAGVTARPISRGLDVDLSAPVDDLAPFASANSVEEVGERLAAAPKRAPTPIELERLAKAAQTLCDRGLISDNALEVVHAFLDSGSLRLVES
jgi:hypothetical protein